MKILIDTADINAIKKAYEYLPMDGVTCNPSILLKNGKNPKDALKEIFEFLDLQKDEFHIQAVGETCEDFLNDAKAITDAFDKDVFIKIPAVLEGYKAMKVLKDKGYRVTATAVYKSEQALFASKIGVNYIAPYYNRIELSGINAMELINDMKSICKQTTTKILGASFKRSEQIAEFSKNEMDAITISPELLFSLTDIDEVNKALTKFNDDFYTLVKGKMKMKDIL